MIYRALGRTGYELSRLGFGAMRLPEAPDGRPDHEASIALLHRAFELGVNYVDTAVGYCHQLSQPIVGEALRRWTGERIYVSTKNHYFGADERAWWKNLENSLSLLGIPAIDIYNFHGMNKKMWDAWVKPESGMLSWMKRAHAQGLVRRICFSFHDNADALREIAGSGEFAAVTLQYNLIDRTLEEALPDVAEMGLGVIVMGPVGGGRLRSGGGAFSELLEGASTPETALRFVLSNPNVTLAISGMSTIEQLEQNAAVAARPEPLTAPERARVDTELSRLQGLADLYCTGCNYCMPCPSGVEIARNFLAVNYDRVYGMSDLAKRMYEHSAGKATYCIACGKCEPKCPQNIPIRVQLRETAARFDPTFGRMALELQPVRRAAEGIVVRGAFHNLADTAAQARVRLVLESAHETGQVPVEVGVDEPFQRVVKQITLPATEAFPALMQVHAEVHDLTGPRIEAFQFGVALCHRVDGVDALWKKADREAPIVVRSVKVKEDGDTMPVYTARAWTGYTDDRFYCCVAFDDARPDEARPTASAPWYLDLLLDLRDREDDLAPGYHDAMVMFHAEPTPDPAQAARIVRGEMDPAQAEVRVDAQGATSRLSIALPWSALIASDAADAPDCTPGNAIGFDLVFGVYAAGGQPEHRQVWTGNQQIHADGRMGTLFFGDAS